MTTTGGSRSVPPIPRTPPGDTRRCKSSSGFSYFSQHLARIALVTREVEADDGAVLLHADQPADAMYVVIDGELRASARGATKSITAGEAVGALALLDDTPLALDVRAVKNSRLLRLTKRDLHDLLHDHPDLAVSLLHGMATRLRGMAS